MNAEFKKPPELTPEALIKSFVAASRNHPVFCRFGESTGSFYNVPEGVEIDDKALSGWLAMPMCNSNGAIISIVYLSDDRNLKPIFDPFIKGCVIFGKPEKDKPLFVVSSPETAFKISMTGNACLLTFTPQDWSNSLEPKDAGNMAYVIKEWSKAGYKRIYAPVGCDAVGTYQIWLKDLSVKVLSLTAPINQYLATPALKSELLELINSTVNSGNVDNELPDDEVNQAIEALAALSELQYQRVRKDEALRLGLSATFLDKEIKRIKSGNDDSKQGRSITFLCDTVEPYAEPVDACELFDFIESQIVASYAVADPIYRHYVTLWGVATWFIDAFRAVPYLNITAPLKNSGKSNLLDVVASFTYKPLIVSDISGSALFRIIEMQSPTLLIDEVDELLRNADNSGLTGLLNDGYRVTGKVIRCVGDNHEPRQFNVFGFKALCGIGQLSKSTTASRCVKVSVRPMAQGEIVNDILHISDDLVNEVNAKLKRLQVDCFDAVKAYDGQHVTHLLNRDRQIWSAIYAIAALGGTKWIDRIKCAERFINDSRVETLDDKVQLLTDIKHVFESLRVDKIHTTILIEHLTDNPDSLWSTYHQSKPIDAKHLALLLSDFGIASKDIRVGQLVRKGYSLDSFSVAFKTYLSTSSSHTPDSAATPLQHNDIKAFSPKTAATNDKVLPLEKPLQPLQGKGCSGVAAKIGGMAEKELSPRNATDNQGSLFI